MFVSDTPFTSTDTVANLASRGDVASSRRVYSPSSSSPSLHIHNFSGATGRYIRIQQNGNQILSLAEVRVYSDDSASIGTALRSDSLNLTGTVNLASSYTTLTTKGDGSITTSGAISGSGGINKSGLGTLTFNAPVSHTGLNQHQQWSPQTRC